MRILTVAAHPDDETLGAGGTMAWHASRGDTVWVCVLTEGVTSRHDRVQLQADCARRVRDSLGVEKLVLAADISFTGAHASPRQDGSSAPPTSTSCLSASTFSRAT